MNTDSENMDTLRDRIEAYVTLVDDYRSDPELRARAESDPAGVLAERGIEVPAGIDLCMVADTAETVHIVLPPDPNAELADEALGGMSGGYSGEPGGFSAGLTFGYFSAATHNPWAPIGSGCR